MTPPSIFKRIIFASPENGTVGALVIREQYLRGFFCAIFLLLLLLLSESGITEEWVNLSTASEKKKTGIIRKKKLDGKQS